VADMILYHFTERVNIPSIRSTGLSPHPLAIPAGGSSSQVVSLTGNPNPTPLIGKSLTDGKHLKGKNLQAYRASIGNPSAPAPITKNTCECRIRLCIPKNDPLLQKISLVAFSLGFSADTLKTFLQLGGGNLNAWWVYLGTLPPQYINEVRCCYPQYKNLI